MATNPSWPDPATTSILGKRTSRIDGPAKTRGEAKYTYDRRRPGMLWGAVARCPHAHARITALDTAAAARIPGVKAVHAVKKVGDEVKWALDEVVYVAAATEAQAVDAARAVKVSYEVLPATVVDDDPKAAGAKEQSPAAQGDPDASLAAARAKIDGTYGLAVVAHLCLESHGQLVEWDGDAITAWCSTQSVSGLPGEFAEGLDVPA
jgi:xanthine dehydrogenase YagR molybdenum-binding subunit